MIHFLIWGGVAIATSLALLKAVDFFWPPVLRGEPAPEAGYWRMPAIMLNQGDLDFEIYLPNIQARGVLKHLESREGNRVMLALDKGDSGHHVIVMSEYDPVDIYDPEAMRVRG